jgi:hypothetical protein
MNEDFFCPICGSPISPKKKPAMRLHRDRWRGVSVLAVQGVTDTLGDVGSGALRSEATGGAVLVDNLGTDSPRPQVRRNPSPLPPPAPAHEISREVGKIRARLSRPLRLVRGG